MKAVVLFSGGIDSTVILALALNRGRECLALSFDYGQRHRIELEAAKQIAQNYGVEHKLISIDSSIFGASSLISHGEVPKHRNLDTIAAEGVPSTYVPARNTLFLAYALGQAEVFGAEEIYFGPNAYDQEPYPDCRPEFVDAFQQVCSVATNHSRDKRPPKIVAPLIHMDKKSIVSLGRKLNAPLEKTHSCYDPSEKGTPCEACDACNLRVAAMQV